MKFFPRLLVACVAWLALAQSASAQLVIDVTTSAGRQIPIAILPFANEVSAPQNITPIVSGNLSRTGLFKLINSTGFGTLPSDGTNVNFAEWSQRGTEVRGLRHEH